MSPPLISEYKKCFALKRLFQTFLGGPRLFSAPIYICIQLVIFILPALLLSLVHYTEIPYNGNWEVVVVGLSIFLVDISLNIAVFLFKRGQRVHVSPAEPDNFLGEEDEVENEGCFKSSTWVFIAPNVTAGVLHILAIICSALSFALSTPIITREGPTRLLSLMGIFALCVARYSAVINLPPELPFDPIRKKDFLQRPFYTLVIGTTFFLMDRISENGVDHFPFNICLALLPFLWVLGLLPPLDAFFPWFFEMILKLLGGTPSFFYFGTVLGIIVAVFCTIFVFIAGQDYTIVIVLECISGYIISSDAGLLMKVKSSLCEDVPTKSFIVQIIKPVLTVGISIGVVLLAVYLEVDKENEIILMPIAFSISFFCWGIRNIILFKKKPPPKLFFILFTIIDGSLTFLIHFWMTVAINLEQKPRTMNEHSLSNLFIFALTIRAFALAVREPKYTSVDLTLATLWPRIAPEDFILEFVVSAFVISILRQKLLRFLKYIKMMLVFFNASILTSLFDKKIYILVCTMTFLPISIASLLYASFVEGATLIPLFTLPIFIGSFPRPCSFWKARWFPKSKREMRLVWTNNCRSLDWTIYSQIGPALAKSFIRKAHKIHLSNTNNLIKKMEEGNCFVARYEDRLIFMRIVTAGWNFVYIQIKGLEMQEQTSCHHQEAAWLDELFDHAFDEKRKRCECEMAKFLSAVKPLFQVEVATYTESKSKIGSLKTTEEKNTFQRMLYRSLSYLLMKYNRDFKKRSIASGCKMNDDGSSTYIRIMGDYEEESELENEEDEEYADDESSRKDYLFKMSPLASQNIIGNDINSNNEGDPSFNFPYLTEMNQSNEDNKGDNDDESRDEFQSLSADNLRKYEVVNLEWANKCLGESQNVSKLLSVRVEKFCTKTWSIIIGDKFSDDIDLAKFFRSDFIQEAGKLSNKSRNFVGTQDFIVKAFRYASKLTLNEIYNLSESEPTPFEIENIEDEIFEELISFEKDYSFSCPSEIPLLLEEHQKNIISMEENENGESTLRIFRFDPGVEFRIGEVSRFAVEGIWATLNLELLYLTSDDDERFSIQHDRYLMRNISTQSADSPLGYAVYDTSFRINQFDFSLYKVS